MPDFLPPPTETERAESPPLEATAVKALVRHRDGYRCRLCRVAAVDHIKRFRKTLEVHRIVPGSAYTVDGCVTLCRRCHDSMPKSKRSSPAERDVANDQENRATFGRRLQAARKALGISQRKLGQIADVTERTLRLIENSRSSPSVELALQLAKAVGISVEDHPPGE